MLSKSLTLVDVPELGIEQEPTEDLLKQVKDRMFPVAPGAQPALLESDLRRRPASMQQVAVFQEDVLKSLREMAEAQKAMLQKFEEVGQRLTKVEARLNQPAPAPHPVAFPNPALIQQQQTALQAQQQQAAFQVQLQHLRQAALHVQQQQQQAALPQQRPAAQHPGPSGPSNP